MQYIQLILNLKKKVLKGKIILFTEFPLYNLFKGQNV